MKVMLLFLFAVGVVAAQAQLNLGLGLSIGNIGPPSPQFFHNVVLRSEAQKVLSTPELPADLQQRVQDTLDAAELGFDSCSTVSALPWFQMRCVALQLSKSKAELKTIENEGKARSQANAANEGTGQSGDEAVNA
ncbi:uncharacterized protein [Eurosta solidaginis]|uniref:uncharacterized protein n=1 Tax=Eurosta solidaginis TaxID=178769 RepID=UPI0035310DE5